MKKQTKITLFIALVGLLITLIPIKAATYTAVVEEDPKPTLTHRQKVWLYTLQFCESKGQDDIKILDSNNKYSYGVLMFQMGTFLEQGKKYNILDSDTSVLEAEK